MAEEPGDRGGQIHPHRRKSLHRTSCPQRPSDKVTSVSFPSTPPESPLPPQHGPDRRSAPGFAVPWGSPPAPIPFVRPQLRTRQLPAQTDISLQVILLESGISPPAGSAQSRRHRVGCSSCRPVPPAGQCWGTGAEPPAAPGGAQRRPQPRGSAGPEGTGGARPPPSGESGAPSPNPPPPEGKRSVNNERLAPASRSNRLIKVVLFL